MINEDKLEGLKPIAVCNKCGSTIWTREEQRLTWSCLKCGNLIYYLRGELIQQIDFVMQSARGKEYVHTTNNTIIPKTSDAIRRIRLIM